MHNCDTCSFVRSSWPNTSGYDGVLNRQCEMQEPPRIISYLFDISDYLRWSHFFRWLMCTPSFCLPSIVMFCCFVYIHVYHNQFPTRLLVIFTNQVSIQLTSNFSQWHSLPRCLSLKSKRFSVNFYKRLLNFMHNHDTELHSTVSFCQFAVFYARLPNEMHFRVQIFRSVQITYWVTFF